MKSVCTRIVFLSALIFCSACFGGTYSGGAGTAAKPYQINTAADWVELTGASGDWDKQFILTANIDLAGISLTPVGPDTAASTVDFQGTPFSGVLNGNGHALRNAQILRPSDDFVGIFGSVTGQIRNLGIMELKVSGKSCVGGLAGRNSGTIENCIVSGDIGGDGSSIGGLVGENRGPVSSCTASVAVSGRSSVGGLIGAQRDSMTGLFCLVTDCTATGPVTGSGSNIGGLVGRNSYGLLISCQATGNVEGTTDFAYPVGGLVGDNYSGGICQCSASGDVENRAGTIGGLVGMNGDNYRIGGITACYATGNVLSLQDGVGGLVGVQWEGSKIQISYSTGTAQGQSSVGGLVGCNYGILENCWATATVTGNTEVGGFVGYSGSSGTASSCYSAGAVSGNQNVGGFSGKGSGATNCFWDRETSRQTTSSAGIRKTTAEMMTQSTFANAGWNFADVWMMNGYPQLRWEHAYSGGGGTQENPYQIGTLADWQTLMKSMSDWPRHFVLTGDLDFSGVTVTPVGNEALPFTGSLDGRGHRISNLYLRSTGSANRTHIGLFGYVGPGGQIRNLGLEKVDVAGAEPVGGLTGFNQGVITACYVTGMVQAGGTTSPEIGGMVGRNSGSVGNCYAQVTTAGFGLVGNNSNGIITNCYSASFGSFGAEDLAPSYTLSRGTIQGSFHTLGDRMVYWPPIRTTAEMRMRITFTAAGWDFVGETTNGSDDLWRMCEDGVDYPRLAWEFSRVGDFACPDGVEMADLLELAGRWLKATPDEAGATDGNGDGDVNYDDFALLGEHWLFRRVPDLVLHLPLDGDYLSSVGNYAGTPQGDPEFVPEGEARIGTGAIAMDNDDSVVIHGYKGIAGSQARTCMAWINTERDNNTVFWWGDPTKPGGLWELGIYHGRLLVNIFGGSLRTTIPVNTGQWVHVAAVLPDRTNRLEDIRLYVNGVLETEPVVIYRYPNDISLEKINTITTSDFCVGVIPAFYSGYIGKIDDIRVYDWAMGREEIAAVTGLFGAEAGKNRQLDLRTESRLTLEGQLFNASGGASAIWEQVSGPDGVVIGDPAALSTPVDFSQEGDYVFRLTATDGTTTATDEMTVTVTNGEVGYWRFDGNLSDDFGHHGNALYPGFSTQSEAKVGSGAINMNGNDWVVFKGFAGIMGTAARTCMAWIKTTGTVGPIVYWGDKNATGGLWDMRVNSGGQLQVQVNGGEINGVSAVNTGQWVHVAAVLPEGGNNAADVLLYVNGVLETGGAVTAGTINTKALATCRVGNDFADIYFTGLIDDVRIYDRALTVAEILAVIGQ